MPRRRRRPVPQADQQGSGPGGRRAATPGRAYPNRTDLNRQPVLVPTGLPYGKRQELEDAQRAVPLPAVPPPPRPTTSTPPPVAMPVMPDGRFDRPTEMPDEPLTAGLPVGPGPGPEAVIGAVNPNADVEAQLIALYRQFPNRDLLRLIRVARERDRRFIEVPRPNA